MAVDDRTRSALDLKNLALPAGLAVVTVYAEAYVDSSGEDALRVWVVLDESADVEKLSGDEVLKLKSSIREALVQRGITLFPYIFLVKESERQPQPAEE